jgi:hypothetical protein
MPTSEGAQEPNVERCDREIAELESKLRAGHPDVEGLCPANDFRKGGTNVSVKVKASAKQEMENRAYKKLSKARFRFLIVSRGIGSILEHDELPSWDLEEFEACITEIKNRLSQAASELEVAEIAYDPYRKRRIVRQTRMRRLPNRGKKTIKES